MIHKNWDINEQATGRFKGGNPIIGATFQNGLNDIEPDGSFVPCDMELEAVNDGVTTHQVRRGRFGELRFTDADSINQHLCKIKYKNGRGISLKYLGGDSPAPDMSSGRPVFNSSDGVIIEHTPYYKGVKIELVINDPLTAPLEYSFSIKDYGQDYAVIEENNGLTIRGEDRDPIFIKAPYAIDANGDIGQVNIVYIGIQNSFKTFKKVVNEAWLRQAAAPVRIDPDITIEDGVGGGVIEDTLFNGGGGLENNNYGGLNLLAMSNFYSGGDGETQSSCVRVGLSSLSGVTPLNGKFLITPAAGNYASYDAKAQKLLKSFIEMQATWNIYATGSSWEAAGAKGATDRAAAIESTFTLTNGGPTVDVGVTVPTLTEWLDIVNHGLLMRNDTGPDIKYIHVGSAEHATNPIQFYMEFTAAAAGNPYYYYAQQ